MYLQSLLMSALKKLHSTHCEGTPGGVGVTPDYIRELRATGLALTEEDEIVGMKVQGVTPECVRGLKELGVQPDADQIIGMKVQGVTPQYIRDLRAAGLHVDADEVVGMRVQTQECSPGVHGATPEASVLPSASRFRERGRRAKCRLATNGNASWETPSTMAKACVTPPPPRSAHTPHLRHCRIGVWAVYCSLRRLR